MKQRLCINITKGNKIFARIAYTWSVHTLNALQEAKELIEAHNGEKLAHIADEKIRLLRILESRGGGLLQNEFIDETQYMRNHYPNEVLKEVASGANGLIAFSAEGMKFIADRAVYELTINFEDEDIYNEVMGCFEELDELENIGYQPDDVYESCEDIDFNFECIHFNMLDDVLAILRKGKDFLFDMETNVYYRIIH